MTNDRTRPGTQTPETPIVEEKPEVLVERVNGEFDSHLPSNWSGIEGTSLGMFWSLKNRRDGFMLKSPPPYSPMDSRDLPVTDVYVQVNLADDILSNGQIVYWEGHDQDRKVPDFGVNGAELSDFQRVNQILDGLFEELDQVTQSDQSQEKGKPLPLDQGDLANLT